ncbi:MAG TPA: CTP--2,3-di-O-geranylgeranyl-sn-glycero-1-phosphate cytidyltransferase [Candidatus Omnitrophota bacterium]|nr:CTP--2,3-di-O-geranylgeranyl-sn-glycero-1-phosphate cytidyltransferase [Candidatus Omnitrophota bacterium]
MNDFIFELRRKLVHILSAFYLFIYYFTDKIFGQDEAILILVFFLVILSFAEFLRIKYSVKIPLFERLYRENEKNNLSGSVYLLIGIIIALSAFDFNIASAAILMAIFGDTASALIGKRIGFKAKFIAEFIVDVAVGFIFLNNLLIIIAMAFTATVVEIGLKSIDDNLAIPVAAGLAGQILAILMKIL